ncbi:MAG: hypothetical protein ACWGSD_07885, partial [Thermodesulfobacteriota bacterium]
MDATILDRVAWKINLPQLKKQLGIKEVDSYAAKAESMAAQAEAIGRPKGMYKAGLIESRGEDHVIIEGQTFKSRVLAVNLEKVHRVFPFVATCGVELEEWSGAFTSVLEPLRAANRLSNRILYAWDVVSRNGEPVTSSSGVTVVPDLATEDAEGFASVVVCSGFDAERCQ